MPISIVSPIMMPYTSTMSSRGRFSLSSVVGKVMWFEFGVLSSVPDICLRKT